MDLHSTAWDPHHLIITSNTHTIFTKEEEVVVVMVISHRPTLACRTTPQDPMDNRGFIFEDQPVNPLPTGQSTTVPTLVNYHRAMKVPQPHPFKVITKVVAVWTVVSCGISNSCLSTMVNCLHQTVTVIFNTSTNTNIRLTSR